MSKTPWYPGRVWPSRAGVYQRLYDEGTKEQEVLFCHFDGLCWFTHSCTPYGALMSRTESGFQTGLKWRGLTKDAYKRAAKEGEA